MSPADRLRSLVKEATQGHAYALETLRARAPQLAELVADMAEALAVIRDGSMLPDKTPRYDAVSENALIADIALARFAALFPEDSSDES